MQTVVLSKSLFFKEFFLSESFVSVFFSTNFLCHNLFCHNFFPHNFFLFLFKTQMFCRSIIPLGTLSTDGRIMTKMIKEINIINYCSKGPFFTNH